MFRIQKLLLEEFREIYEPVIVENPFTQVTDKGLGIRQYHIGVFSSKVGDTNISKAFFSKVSHLRKSYSAATILIKPIWMTSATIIWIRRSKLSSWSACCHYNFCK